MNISNIAWLGLFRGVVAAFSIAFTSLGAYASPIVYNIFDDFGTATISGTITTDGTIGAIFNTNISDWDLLLDDGTTSTTLTNAPLNSVLFAGNGSLLASLTNLAFDHSINQIFLIRDFAIQNFWCLEGPSNGCFGNPSSSNISVGGRFNQHVNSGRTGLSVLGTYAVPEPPVLGLLGAGLLGLGVFRRRQAKQAI